MSSAIKALNKKLKDKPIPPVVNSTPSSSFTPLFNPSTEDGNYDDYRDLSARLAHYVTHENSCLGSDQCECGLSDVLELVKQFSLVVCADCKEHASDGEGKDKNLCMMCADEVNDDESSVENKQDSV